MALTAGRGAGNPLDFDALVGQQVDRARPGEGAVRAAALQSEIDLLATVRGLARLRLRRVAGPLVGCVPGEDAGQRLPSANGMWLTVIYSRGGPAPIDRKVGAGDGAGGSEHRYSASRRDLRDGDELLGRLRASSTSRLTCSSVSPRAFMVSGICFSTSGVQT